MTRILLAIYPSCDRQLIVDCLFDDNGEIASGDLPYPVKAENPELKRTIDNIAARAHQEMILPWSLPVLRPLIPHIDKWTMKLAEMIETWEFAGQEMMMGNGLAELPMTRNAEWLYTEIAEKVGDPLFADICERAGTYIMRRRHTWPIMS